jgi:hypothetical protein
MSDESRNFIKNKYQSYLWDESSGQAHSNVREKESRETFNPSSNHVQINCCSTPFLFISIDFVSLDAHFDVTLNLDDLLLMTRQIP